MNREEKKKVIDKLTDLVNSHKHLYISDIAGLNAANTQKLRRACFDANIKLIQVKNTLLKKALENAKNNYEEIFVSLKGSSAIMLCETGNAPAKLIKEFRKTSEQPAFKAAFVEECAYIGENQLDSLINIKSREELIGDIVLMLQTPMQNVLSALQYGQNTIAGVVKTLSEK
jgi:large subunit ribosomal protein L10